MNSNWFDFKGETWKESVNVRDFIQENYVEYTGDSSFMSGPTEKTSKLWNKCKELVKEEIGEGKYGIDLETVAGIDNFRPGYIDKENEVILGLQTDKPLQRIINPYGGLRMVESVVESKGLELAEEIRDTFSGIRKTHNEAVFGMYTDQMRTARHVGLLTGLPDAYGRGRVIGDYRRITLYGIDFLIEDKKRESAEITDFTSEKNMRLREELKEQINALHEIKSMGLKYGIDMSNPAKDAKEAVQFIYFSYLAGAKESNGAAMSLGRISTFMDIFIDRDLRNGKINEDQAQELVDQFVIKLRMIRHLRTEEYDQLFAGDPTWITECLGGVGVDGRSLVTKTSFRFLNTLDTIDPSPEPNMTVLWSNDLPNNFKRYVSEMSIKTSSIQYENDDIMRPIYGDDYGIACCVSAMKIGKQSQFFGARCNLAKALLYSINGGYDETYGTKVLCGVPKMEGEELTYEKVMENFDLVLDKISKLYVDTMNIIHFSHDKYAYERAQFSLHDRDVQRFMAFGVAGLSVVVDSLSAIKHGDVKAIRENGIAKEFITDDNYPKFGNDDDRVDEIAVDVMNRFITKLRKHKTYRDAVHTISVLTITSNVVYGKKTGSTPDGRKAGVAFAPGANPMHNRDTSGALASLNSVSKIPYENVCQDGVSNTFTIIPDGLGRENDRIDNLKGILDGYFMSGGHHLNVNVLDKKMLLDAVEYPEKYPLLTIRVSGYAVHFNRLTLEQKKEVISRTFHEKIA